MSSEEQNDKESSPQKFPLKHLAIWFLIIAVMVTFFQFFQPYSGSFHFSAFHGSFHFLHAIWAVGEGENLNNIKNATRRPVAVFIPSFLGQFSNYNLQFSQLQFLHAQFF